MKKSLTLRPVRPNAGIEAKYRERLDRLIREMQKSVVYWVHRTYKANEPEISKLAQDASPAATLRRVLRELARRWTRQFDKLAPKLAAYFAKEATKRSDAQLKSILKKAGFTVEFKMKAVERDIVDATIAENVGLIKSIPQQYFTEVEGLVMRSVQSGRDLGQLTDELETRYDVTRNRAATIARDQNNKATANMTRARQMSIGIERAIWMHSHGGRKPRPTHVANDGKEYEVAKGWFDPAVGAFVWPGQLINCRCVSRPVIGKFLAT